jgi:hypothetical protein
MLRVAEKLRPAQKHKRGRPDGLEPLVCHRMVCGENSLRGPVEFKTSRGRQSGSKLTRSERGSEMKFSRRRRVLPLELVRGHAAQLQFAKWERRRADFAWSYRSITEWLISLGQFPAACSVVRLVAAPESVISACS